MLTDVEISVLLRKHTLLNATSHNGRADLGAVIGRLMAERSDLRSESKRIALLARNVVSEINALALDEQNSALEKEFPESVQAEIQKKKELSKKDSEKSISLPPLPEARDGDVVTRFPPEPNGFMHIGHAKAALLGSEYAKMYKGRFIMRFDDTNPSAEKKEYYGAFLDSFDWLEIKPDTIRNSSDDMERYYELAEKMLENGTAYICSCSQELMRERRSKGEECEHRNQTPKENLSLWRKMTARELGKSDATFRFLGEMHSLNTTMRDPVLFRIIEDPHPLLGNKFVVWPTYDFAGPIEDSLDGVTHAMRSKEYELRDELYHAILKALKMRDPRVIEFSRLKLQNTTVSKRTLAKLIREKLVEGWDDPRLPTISALRRRGFLPEAIREFILSMGISKVESEPTWDLLESYNRKLLDPMAKRYFFVANPVKLRVMDAPRLKVTLKYHPEAQLGHREIATSDSFFIPSEDSRQLKVGSNFRLIEAFNVQIIKIENEIIHGKYLGEERTVDMPKLQWVSEGQEYPMVVKVPGPLLLNDEFNPNSLKIVNGLAESAVAEIRPGEIFQFVRFGFCRMDSPGTGIRTHS
jgi:glutamyl-tRNA synthetase